MNTEAKRDAIREIYGDYFRGQPLSEMPVKQVHTVYSRIINELGSLRNQYFVKHNYSRAAMEHANEMSLFELRKSLKNKDEDQEGYQYTIFDWQQYLEGKEQEKEWQQKMNTEKEVM